MTSSKKKPLFQEILSNAGHRMGITIPVCVGIASVLAQYIFTDYFDQTSRPVLAAIVLISLTIVLSEYLSKHIGRRRRMIQYLALHLVAVLACVYTFPTTTPYLVYLMLVSLLVFFDFGLKPMLLSLVSLMGVATVSYLRFYGLGDMSNFSAFLVYIAGISIMTYYAAQFLQIAQDELVAVEDSTAKALANQKQVESLMNNITDGVIAVDNHFKIAIYNAAALDVLDINTEINQSLLNTVFKPIDENSQTVDICELLKNSTASVVNRDLRIKYSDGSIANLFVGIAPIYLGYGKSTHNGYTLILRDITREKSLEEERDEFISVVSHELRTPIAISEGNISNAEFIVEKTGDISAVKAALKEAHRQVLFLADMINDLSTLSRAERGTLQVEPEAINVHELCQELLSNYTPSATEKGLALKLELDPKLELLQSGKLYVREVLQNFITNAIKYTEKGVVTISAKPGENGAVFSIRDTGIGISKGDQERVYDKFFRSEDFRTRQNNGTGLGLYVTMKLARLIHADITLESELNKGSTFTIRIPNLK